MTNLQLELQVEILLPLDLLPEASGPLLLVLQELAPVLKGHLQRLHLR